MNFLTVYWHSTEERLSTWVDKRGTARYSICYLFEVNTTFLQYSSFIIFLLQHYALRNVAARSLVLMMYHSSPSSEMLLYQCVLRIRCFNDAFLKVSTSTNSIKGNFTFYTDLLVTLPYGSSKAQNIALYYMINK